MSKVNPIQTNFSAGEISPLLYGRTDIQKYANGAAKLLNFITKPQGGVSARPGTLFVGEVKNSNNSTRLIPFEFSETVAYILELGNNYVRFIYNGSYVVVGAGPTIHELATPWVTADLPDIKFAQSADVLYLCHPAYPPQKITRTGTGGFPALSASTFTIAAISFLDGPYLPENNTDIELRIAGTVTDEATITTSVNTFVVGDVGKFIQYTKDGSYRLAKITAYTSATVVTVEPQDNIIPDVDKATKLTYAAPNITATLSIFTSANIGAFVRIRETNAWYKITAFTSATAVVVAVPVIQVAIAGTTLVTETNRTIISFLSSSAPVFTATDLQRRVRLDLDTQQLWGTITIFTNSQLVFVFWDRDIPINESDYSNYAAFGKTLKWRLGAWSGTTGYPSAIAFHEERLVFAASPVEPQTVWMSVSGDYENFSPTQDDSKVFDDNAITLTLASGKVNAIKWLDSGPTLVIGTLGGCWQIRASSLNEALTPTNINAQAQNAAGSSKIQPVRITSSLLFIQRLGGKLRELFYDYQTDSLVDKDISIISEHLLRENGGVKEIAFQEYRNSSLWVCLNNGKLACMTYVKEQEVYSWHLHELAGDYGSLGRASVESICCIPSPASDNRLYLVVARTINGVTKRYVEYMSAELSYTPAPALGQMVFTDSSKIYPHPGVGLPFSVLTGLGHLEGKAVSVLVDGTTAVSKVVSGGSVNLAPVTGMEFVAGLAYYSTLKTLTPEGGGNFGTAQGKNKRIHKCVVRVLSSAGFKYGATESGTLFESPLGVNLTLVSKDIELTIQDENRLTPQVVIVRDKPFPLNILALMPEINVNG